MKNLNILAIFAKLWKVIYYLLMFGKLKIFDKYYYWYIKSILLHLIYERVLIGSCLSNVLLKLRFCKFWGSIKFIFIVIIYIIIIRTIKTNKFKKTF